MARWPPKRARFVSEESISHPQKGKVYFRSNEALFADTNRLFALRLRCRIYHKKSACLVKCVSVDLKDFTVHQIIFW